MRHFFFAINFSIYLFFLYGCILSVIAPYSPGSFLGGLFFFFPILFLLTTEWVAWYRKHRIAETVSGGWCLAISALALFGTIANVGEAITQEWPDRLIWDHDLIWFILIGLIIACYFGVCGIYRLRSKNNKAKEK